MVTPMHRALCTFFMCSVYFSLECPRTLFGSEPSNIQSILSEYGRTESKITALPQMDRTKILEDLRDRLVGALAASPSDPSATSGQYRLAELDMQLGQYNQAESQYTTVAKRQDADPTMQVQAWIGAYQAAISAAKNPTEIDRYLMAADVLCSNASPQGYQSDLPGDLDLEDPSEQWSHIKWSLNGLRVQADLAYGNAAAHDAEKSGMPDRKEKVNQIRAKWLKAAIVDCGKYAADLHKVKAAPELAWLRVRNMGEGYALYNQASLISQVLPLVSSGDEQSQLRSEEIGVLEAAVKVDRAGVASDAAAALFTVKNSAAPALSRPSR
jgi:hypothetical protein